MAIVLAPLSSWDARNKFGPLQVFTGWRTLPVVRSLVVPTNPRTGDQSYVRSILSALSQAWGGLSAGQVAAWRDWGNSHEYVTALGQKFRGTGLNAFLELNFPQYYNVETYATSPPSVAYKGNITNFDVHTDPSPEEPGSIECTWTLPVGAVSTDWTRIDVTSQMPNRHRLAQASDWRIYAFRAGNIPSINMTGLVPSGWYWVRGVYTMQDGQRGVWQVGQAQAQAA